MANVTIAGATYSDVPAIQVPSGSGTALFYETKDVTYNLTGGATASVTPSEAVTGQGFSVKLKAPSGYNLSNVTVTMGGVDITSQVFTPDEQGGGGGGGGTYVRTEILASQTITPDSTNKRATLTGLAEGFVNGDYYVVTYDGTEWILTCSLMYSTNYLIGDINYFYGSSDALPIPFGIIWMSGTTATLATYNTNQHTVKIEHLEFIEDGVTLGTKTITQNGTYNASSDSADGYSSVTVAVPNSYAAGDEGKVVSNGALVAQGSDTVTQNGTVDTTLISSLLVNVAGISPVKTKTGTFTGNGTRQVTISCDFEPDLIYWTSDPGTTASSGVVAGIIAREMMAASRYRNNSTTNSHYAVIDITAMNTGGSSYSFRATYSNNTITLYGFSNNARALFTSGRTYSYKLVKWTT